MLVLFFAHRLVQEYCDCGTLGNVANRLRESGSADSMLKLVLLLFDVANGLKVLHSRMTVHGDLVSRHGVPVLVDLASSLIVQQPLVHRTCADHGRLLQSAASLLVQPCGSY